MKALISLMVIIPLLANSASFEPMGCIGVSDVDCSPDRSAEPVKRLHPTAQALAFARSDPGPVRRRYGQAFINEFKSDGIELD